MKVYCVLYKTLEDGDVYDCYEEDTILEKEAEVIKIFDSEKKAEDYIEELYKEWLLKHKKDLKGADYNNPRDVWEEQFFTTIKEVEVE